MKTVATKELKEMLAQNGQPHVVDVLPEKNYKRAHLPGAVNIPYAHDDFVQRVERAVGGKKARTVVYCADEQCDLSRKAAETLEKAGFEDVLDFEGGVKAWSQADQPLEGEIARETAQKAQ